MILSHHRLISSHLAVVCKGADVSTETDIINPYQLFHPVSSQLSKDLLFQWSSMTGLFWWVVLECRR